MAGRTKQAEGVTDQPVEDKGLQIGDGLYVRKVRISALKEQDVNAQVMQSKQFDRLTENIRIRGALESLPYCHQPKGEGPISIVSGHHRARAARAAGLAEIAVIVDEYDYPRSTIIAKQIAHNELHGDSDDAILRQLVAMIDDVDDMLMSGLDEEFLATVPPDDTNLLVPSADFDWRMVTMMFLPSQLDEFETAVSMVERKTEFIGLANKDQFEAFSAALIDYGRTRNIKSMASTVATLIDLAQREIEETDTDGRSVNAKQLDLHRLTEEQAAHVRHAIDVAKTADPDVTPGDLIAQWAEKYTEDRA